MNYDQIFQKIDNARHNIIKRVEEIVETYESPIDCPEDLEIVVEECDRVDSELLDWLNVNIECFDEKGNRISDIDAVGLDNCIQSYKNIALHITKLSLYISSLEHQRDRLLNQC